MTCIVGCTASDGGLVIGGDSLGSDGSICSIIKTPKVFRKGELLIGYTSSYRFGQVVAHAFEPPPFHEFTNPETYLVTSFIPALRTALKESGFSTKFNEQEYGGAMLIGARGRLFYVQSDYSVLENADGLDACGSGGQVALGAMWAARRLGAVAERIVETGLQAAEQYTPSVRGPFLVAHVPAPQALTERKEFVEV